MLGRGTARLARALSACRSPAAIAEGRRMSSTNAPINHWLEPKNIKKDHARTLLGAHGPVENADIITSTEILSKGCESPNKIPFPPYLQRSRSRPLFV